MLWRNGWVTEWQNSENNPLFPSSTQLHRFVGWSCDKSCMDYTCCSSANYENNPGDRTWTPLRVAWLLRGTSEHEGAACPWECFLPCYHRHSSEQRDSECPKGRTPSSCGGGTDGYTCHQHCGQVGWRGQVRQGRFLQKTCCSISKTYLVPAMCKINE